MQKTTIPSLKDIRITFHDDGLHEPVMREEPSPDWMLRELLYHIVNLCIHVRKDISVRTVLDIGRRLPREVDVSAPEENIFSETFQTFLEEGQEMLRAFEKSISDETIAAWEKLNEKERGTAYLKTRNAALPHYQARANTARFLWREYPRQPIELRTVTELALSGLLLTAVNDPEFPALCKDKDLDVSSMTVEQKMDTELDHEALYRYAQDTLGGIVQQRTRG